MFPQPRPGKVCEGIRPLQCLRSVADLDEKDQKAFERVKVDRLLLSLKTSKLAICRFSFADWNSHAHSKWLRYYEESFEVARSSS